MGNHDVGTRQKTVCPAPLRVTFFGGKTSRLLSEATVVTLVRPGGSAADQEDFNPRREAHVAHLVMSRGCTETSSSDMAGDGRVEVQYALLHVPGESVDDGSRT